MLDFSISSTSLYYYPIIICFIFLLYSYYRVLLTKYKIYLPLIFRSISISLILLLLFNPKIDFLKKNKIDKKINVFIDNSQSIKEHMKNNNISMNNLFDKMNNWANDNNVIVDYYTFSDSIYKIDNPLINIQYDKPLTNYSDLFTYIKSLHSNDEIIIISDGAKNYGYNTFDIVTSNIINTIGLG